MSIVNKGCKQRNKIVGFSDSHEDSSDIKSVENNGSLGKEDQNTHNNSSGTENAENSVSLREDDQITHSSNSNSSDIKSVEYSVSLCKDDQNTHDNDSDNDSDNDCDNGNDSDSDNKNNISSVWLVEALFFHIMSYLECIELSKLQGLNKMFEYELNHQFICDCCHIYFKYNKNEIKQILQDQLCHDLSLLVKFYFSFLNIIYQTILFEEEIGVFSPDESLKQYTGEFLFGVKYNGNNEDKDKDNNNNSEVMKLFECVLNFEHNNRYCYYTCNIERLIYSIMKFKNSQCNNLFDNESTPVFLNIFILSMMHNCIKPLVTQFNYLLRENEHFRYRITQSRKNFYHLKNCVNGMDEYISTSDLSYHWKSLDISHGAVCFSLYYNFQNEMKGRFSFFSELLCKGNFDRLITFMDKNKEDDASKLKDSCCMYGVLSMIVAFLRDDLLDNYYVSPSVPIIPSFGGIEVTGEFFGCNVETFSQALLFLIDPNLLIQLKNHLLYMMISFTKEELFEFDLFLNPRYHPLHRIKFLWKLCWSSHFLKQFYNIQLTHTDDGSNLSKDADFVHARLLDTISLLYNNQNEFEYLWNLNKYSDLANDKSKKDMIYNQFRIVIQGLCALSQFDCTRGPNNNNRINTHDGYFNLLPQNEMEMEQMYDAISSEFGEALKLVVESPMIRDEFRFRVHRRKTDHNFSYRSIEKMKFDLLKNDTPKSFFIKLCNLYSYDENNNVTENCAVSPDEI